MVDVNNSYYYGKCLRFSYTFELGSQILDCVSAKFTASDLDIHTSDERVKGLKQHEYYHRLSSARFGLALPGLGYDCYRWAPSGIGTRIYSVMVDMVAPMLWIIGLILTRLFRLVWHGSIVPESSNVLRIFCTFIWCAPWRHIRISVWELMTMGTIVIIERGIGLDRSVRIRHRHTLLQCDDKRYFLHSFYSVGENPTHVVN